MSAAARHILIRCLLAVLGIAAMTAVLELFRTEVNSTTVALGLLLVVLFAATFWGSKPAIVASIVGMACFNFFFLPPVRTFSIADPDNWIALAAFLITALTVGQLSARAKRRAEEAETGQRENERLYRELRDAFERASHAEALRQSEKLKSALLDAVTHDIRMPLTSIKASVTTLLDETRTREGRERPSLDEESRAEMLEIINEESDRLNRFIEGLVELARIEAGEMHLRPRWGAVDEMVSMALARAEPRTVNHRIEVLIETDLPVVRVDPQAVSEVVYTLVDNAAKYSPPASVIRVRAGRAPSRMIKISVEDQGEGIPVELRERVFDKFFRATRDGASLGGPVQGTGLGLAIAKGIVEAHGGRIYIEDDARAVGTRFVFTLPIGDEEDLVVTEEGEQEKLVEPSNR